MPNAMRGHPHAKPNGWLDATPFRFVALVAPVGALTAFTRWLGDSVVHLTVPARAMTGDPRALSGRSPARHGFDRAADWVSAGGAGGDHYSPLAEITRANVDSLQVAWIYRTGDVSDGLKEGSGPSTAFESTPLLINGLLYLATPSARVVALDPERGTERWAFDAHLDRASLAHDEVTVRGVGAWIQLVHHDLWDYDVAAQPALATVVRDGVAIPALVQESKTGMVFVLNRLTGVPVFPVEERPVPASDVPGEGASPTQPFIVLVIGGLALAMYVVLSFR